MFSIKAGAAISKSKNHAALILILPELLESSGNDKLNKTFKIPAKSLAENVISLIKHINNITGVPLFVSSLFSWSVSNK